MKEKTREEMLEEVFSKRNNYKTDSDNLKRLNKAESELNELLIKNQKELDELSKGFDNVDIDDFQKEIEKDFNVSVEDKIIVKDKETFKRIENYLKEKVIGQNKAVEKITDAIHRPYITGNKLDEIRNSIILYGPNGTGRHMLIEECAKAMKKEGLIKSSDIYHLDMSRYPSSAQEILFLQDLYVALNNKGSVICIENFEMSSPIFNRMLSDLVVNGKVLLNKRYTFSNNQLQEATSKLSTEVIDSLKGNNKVLVFISDKNPSKMMDYFGMSFLDKIQDKVETIRLDDDSLKTIIENMLIDLKLKCLNQLEINLTIEDSINNLIMEKYEPNDGVDSISPIIKKIYDALVETIIKEDIKDANISYTDTLVIRYNDKSVGYEIFKSNNTEREEIQKELDEIVGLNEVKEYLLSLEDHLRISQIRKQKGLKTSEISKHMVFTGNPGTGKTTIARLVSRMMKACGVLKQGQLVEVTRADLVGKYVGHTAPLTKSVIDSALGGVLFIDEAYSLYRGKDDSFGLEAIDTLVKAMEDHRDDLIVILAGYSREMEEFLKANSGLKSRFANIINFEDYTGEELMFIAKSIAKSKDYRIDEKALEPLKQYFSKIQENADNTSGNGRLARNIVEEAILRQSKRLLRSADSELDLLILEDFEIEEKK